MIATTGVQKYCTKKWLRISEVYLWRKETYGIGMPSNGGINGPARSLDLSNTYFLLWEFLNKTVYQNQQQTLQCLKV